MIRISTGVSMKSTSPIRPQLPYFCPSFFSKILLLSYFLQNYGPIFLLLFHLDVLESLRNELCT